MTFTPAEQRVADNHDAPGDVCQCGHPRADHHRAVSRSFHIGNTPSWTYCHACPPFGCMKFSVVSAGGRTDA